MLLGQKLDTKTKFKLLDMIDNRPIELIDSLDPKSNTLTSQKLDEMLANEYGYLVIDSIFAD